MTSTPPEPLVETHRHQLLSLSVVGGFLDGQHFAFNRDLNTVIGARGTGKTTVLEQETLENLLTYLLEWFIRHTTTEDRKIGVHAAHKKIVTDDEHPIDAAAS